MIDRRSILLIGGVSGESRSLTGLLELDRVTGRVAKASQGGGLREQKWPDSECLTERAYLMGGKGHSDRQCG